MRTIHFEYGRLLSVWQTDSYWRHRWKSLVINFELNRFHRDIWVHLSENVWRWPLEVYFFIRNFFAPKRQLLKSCSYPFTAIFSSLWIKVVDTVALINILSLRGVCACTGYYFRDCSRVLADANHIICDSFRVNAYICLKVRNLFHLFIKIAL